MICFSPLNFVIFLQVCRFFYDGGEKHYFSEIKWLWVESAEEIQLYDISTAISCTNYLKYTLEMHFQLKFVVHLCNQFYFHFPIYFQKINKRFFVCSYVCKITFHALKISKSSYTTLSYRLALQIYILKFKCTYLSVWMAHEANWPPIREKRNLYRSLARKGQN